MTVLSEGSEQLGLHDLAPVGWVRWNSRQWGPSKVRQRQVGDNCERAPHPPRKHRRDVNQVFESRLALTCHSGLRVLGRGFAPS